MEASAQVQIVQDLIKSDKVVIFSKSYCRHSKLAKEIFNKINQSFTAIELDSRSDGSAIQDILLDMTGARTVPRVFVKGNFIGGASDVKDMHEGGKLEPLLK